MEQIILNFIVNYEYLVFHAHLFFYNIVYEDIFANKRRWGEIVWELESLWKNKYE